MAHDAFLTALKTKWKYLPTLFVAFTILQCMTNVAVLTAPVCSHLEVQTCNEDELQCHCIPCRTCPPGEGLDPECGSKVLLRVPFCAPCQNGVTYSSKESVESCQPCPLCHGRKVLQSCNRTHPTICSHDCDEGFVLNEAVNDCQPIPTPTPNTTHKYPVVKKPNINSSSTNDSHSIHVEKRSPHDKKGSKNHRPIDQQSSKDPDKYVKIYIFTALGLAITYAAGYLLYINWGTLQPKLSGVLKYRWCSVKGPLNDELLQVFIPDSILLSGISPGLQRNIATLLNKQANGTANWRDIGHWYEMSRLELDEIAEYYHSNTNSPGNATIEAIISKKPLETLNGFIAVLQSFKRRDVIQVIKDEYTACTTSP